MVNEPSANRLRNRLGTRKATSKTDLASPVEVEITETGRSGIRAKIPSGQIVRFAYDRGVQRLPAGWVPVVGEKARVTFRLDAERGFTVGYWAQNLEKLP